MTQQRVVAIATALVVVMMLAVVWFRLEAQAPPPAVWTIVFDPSWSQPRDCAAEADMARTAVQQMAQSGGTLRVLKIGDRTSANSPAVVMSVSVRPRVVRVLQEDRAERDIPVAAEVALKCESAKRGMDSPVYIALRDAVQDAAQRGAPGSARHVLLRSDMRETVIKPIQRALNRPHGSDMPDLPPKIANDGVTILSCGFAETIGYTGRNRAGAPLVLTRPRTADAGDRLVEVWRNLFSNPELVRIVPFCDRAQTVN